MIPTLTASTRKVLFPFILSLCLGFAAGSAQSASVSQTDRLLHVSNGVSLGSPFSRPLGIFFDKTRGECFVADTGNHRVVVCDINGMPLFHFYHQVTLNDGRILGEPRSIVVDSSGRIFLTDALVPYIDVLDPIGRTITRIFPPAGANEKSGRFDFLNLGPDDRVYATISGGAPKVAVIGPDLSVIKLVTMKSPETDRSCFTGIAIDSAGIMYVTDPCAPTMVQMYNEEGEFISSFGRHDAGFENFSFPAGISIMANGDIWIVDSIRQIASRFSRNGQFLSHIGGKGTGPGALNYPSGISTNGDDLLFILERVGERYQCFLLRHDNSEEEVTSSIATSHAFDH